MASTEPQKQNPEYVTTTHFHAGTKKFAKLSAELQLSKITNTSANTGAPESIIHVCCDVVCCVLCVVPPPPPPPLLTDGCGRAHL